MICVRQEMALATTMGSWLPARTSSSITASTPWLTARGVTWGEGGREGGRGGGRQTDWQAGGHQGRGRRQGEGKRWRPGLVGGPHLHRRPLALPRVPLIPLQLTATFTPPVAPTLSCAVVHRQVYALLDAGAKGTCRGRGSGRRQQRVCRASRREAGRGQHRKDGRRRLLAARQAAWGASQQPAGLQSRQPRRRSLPSQRHPQPRALWSPPCVAPGRRLHGCISLLRLCAHCTTWTAPFSHTLPMGPSWLQGGRHRGREGRQAG